MITIQEILKDKGYNTSGMDNRNRAVKNINTVLKNIDITIDVASVGKVWVSNDKKKYNIKIGLPSVGSIKQHIDIDGYEILKMLALFLRNDKVREKIYSETEVPHTCPKCDGKGVLPEFEYYANGVCFDCLGLGMVGKLVVNNVQDKKTPLTGRLYIKQFYVVGWYNELFPKDVERIKPVGMIGHPTAEQWLSKKDGIYYIHQPICEGNSWYAVPEEDFPKFKKEFNYVNHNKYIF